MKHQTLLILDISCESSGRQDSHERSSLIFFESCYKSGFVRTITSTFMHEFLNNLAQLFSLINSSAV